MADHRDVTRATIGSETQDGRADTPREAQGRRTLSTAFVQVGPDGLLSVALRDGRVILLRNVTMGRRTFCGAPLGVKMASGRFCAGYADVLAAKAGNTAAF